MKQLRIPENRSFYLSVKVHAPAVRMRGETIKNNEMKTILILLLLSSCVPVPAQVKQYCKDNAITWSCMLLAGTADGLAESFKFHPVTTANTLNLHGGFWNNDGSNKYKPGTTTPKFWGSTTIFVGLTDSYHACRTIRNTAILTGLAFKIGHKQKWYRYLGDMAIAGIIYSIGFINV